MIFKTQRLQQLKKIQNNPIHSKYINKVSTKIIAQTWPQSNNKTFCQTIQQMSIKWMNQFLVLIQNWLGQCSNKYINKLQELKKSQQANKQPSTIRIQEYLINLSRYIKSMQYPLMSSLNNIYNLYLKFPTDQMIQSPVKKLSKPVSSIECRQQKQIKNKRKSLSIDSFTSNLPVKSRSMSKSRKLSSSIFNTTSLSSFNNSRFNNTIANNMYQTVNIVAKQYKQKDYINNNNNALNTTVKKVKKQINFNNSNKNYNNTTSSMIVNNNTNNKHNQNCQLQQQQYPNNNNNNASILKQRLQQRLSKTCSSTFFNQVILSKPQSTIKSINLQQQYLSNKNNNNNNNQPPHITVQNSKPLLTTNTNIQQQLKKQIIQQISMKDKQHYNTLIKDIEDKMNNKFNIILQKLTQQNHNKQPNYNNNQQQLKINQQICKNQHKDKDFHKKQPQSQQNYQQQSFNNNNQQSSQQKLKSAQKIQQTNKQNTSILQKDPSKIIKSNKSNKNNNNTTFILENTKSKKQLLSTQNNNNQYQLLVKNHQNKTEKVQNQNNKIKNKLIQPQDSSLDSIDIIDSYTNKPIKFNNNNNNNNIKAQHHVKQSFVNENNSNNNNKPVQKKEDNFYMRRIKQQKTKMQTSLKYFKLACDNLALPVNQSFSVMFALSYKSFCQVNSLSMQSSQANQIIFSKYSSQTQLHSKLPPSEEKFLIDSLIKIQKMVNLKCPVDKKFKIEEYTKSCLNCIQNVYFEKPNLQLQCEPEILKKIRDIKSQLAINKAK